MMQARRLASVAGRVLLVLAASLAVMGPARAHPHVFIETRTKVIAGNGGFIGVQHRWTFDEYYSATAIEGLDTNKDGIYSREELAELAKVNIDGLKEFAFFTAPTAGGKEIKLGEVTEYWLEHKDGLLTLVFMLPFEEPVPIGAKDFRIGVADPTFFIGFAWARKDAFTLGEGAPADCKISLGAEADGKSKPDSGDGTLGGAFSQQFGGAGVISADQTAAIACGAR